MRRLVPLLVLLLAGPACTAGSERGGEPSPPARSPWEEQLRADLTDLRRDGDVVSPLDQRRLVPVAQAALVLGPDLRWRPEVEAEVTAYWDAESGLFHDPTSAEFDLLTSLLAVRVLTPARVDATAMVTAVAKRRRGSSYAWRPGGTADPLATLFATRLLAALGRPVASPSAAACSAPAGARTPLDLARELDLARAAGHPCRPHPSWSAVASRAVDGALSVAESGAPVDEQRAADLAAALRLGVSVPDRPAALDRLVAGVSALLTDDTAAGRLPAGSTAGTALSLRDALETAGAVPRAGSKLRERLERTIRWRGRLPEIARPADYVEEILALDMLGERAVSARARSRPESFLAAHLVLAPDALEDAMAVRALDDLLRSFPEDPRVFGIVGWTLRERPAACSKHAVAWHAMAEQVADGISRSAGGPNLATLYWVALGVRGAPCGLPAAILGGIRTEAGRTVAEQLRGLTEMPPDGALVTGWRLTAIRCYLELPAVPPPDAGAELERARALPEYRLIGSGQPWLGVLPSHAARWLQAASAGCPAGVGQPATTRPRP